MKGVLFSQFLHFAEDEFGPEVAGRLRGARSYSPGGDYDHRVLLRLVRRLGKATGCPPGDLLRRFGTALFRYFARMYPTFFLGVDSALAFLSRIETYVHGELIKLYPGAQFPRFEVTRPSPDRLEMVYRSQREMADLAEGLIRGCVRHFGETIELHREDLPATGEQAVRFVLVSRSAPGAPA